MFSYHGGLLWIDFINTEFLHQGEVRDQIESGQAFAEWAHGAGFQVADASDEVWSMLRELRGELRRLAEETVEAGQVPAHLIERLNERLASIRGTWRVEGQRAVFVPEGDAVAWPILQSVIDFLTANSVARLKKCGNHQCIQYYYDTSKNNTRRWCRMDVCGNREKAKRHYQKKTGSAEEQQGGREE